MRSPSDPGWPQDSKNSAHCGWVLIKAFALSKSFIESPLSSSIRLGEGSFMSLALSFGGDWDSALLKRARISIFLSIRNKTKAQFNICASSLKRQNYPTKQQVSKICLATERWTVAGLLLKGAFRAPIVGFA